MCVGKAVVVDHSQLALGGGKLGNDNLDLDVAYRYVRVFAGMYTFSGIFRDMRFLFISPLQSHTSQNITELSQVDNFDHIQSRTQHLENIL